MDRMFSIGAKIYFAEILLPSFGNKNNENFFACPKNIFLLKTILKNYNHPLQNNNKGLRRSVGHIPYGLWDL